MDMIRGSRMIIAALAATMCMLLWSFAIGSAQITVDISQELVPEPETARGYSEVEVEGPGAFEPNDQMTSSKEITVGAEFYQRHYFEDTGDVDWAKFRAWAYVDYTLETYDLDTGNDTILCLYDEDKNLKTCDTDGLSSKIVWSTPATGTRSYFIETRPPYSEGYEGFAYSLRVIGSDPCIEREGGEYEPDDNMESATPIELGETQEHNFHGPCGGDVDWVRFEALTDTVYTIQTLNLGPDNDTVLQLYDSEGKEVASDDDDLDNASNILASRIDWAITTTNVGTYYVKVAPFNRSIGGCDIFYMDYDLSYDLKVSTSTITPTIPVTPDGCTDDFEPDDSAGEAQPIVINGVSQEHSIHAAGDEDWAKFWVSTGSQYTIRTFDLAPGNNTMICLYGPDNLLDPLIPCSGIDTRSSKLVWVPAEDGTYFAKITHKQPEAGGCLITHSLEITSSILCEDDYEQDDTWEQAKLISIDDAPQSHSFHLPCHYNHEYEVHPPTEDWVRFEAQEGIWYGIKTSNLEGGNDTILELYETKGDSVFPITSQWNDDYANDIPASRIVWKAEKDGEYFVKVSPFDHRIGGCNVSYDLEVLPWITGLDLYSSQDYALADGEMTATLTALVENDDGKTVSDETVCFTTTLGELSDADGCVHTNSDGVAQVVLTSTDIGAAMVTAAVDFISDTVLVSFTPPSLTLAASPAEIPADGTTTSTLTASVSDHGGAAVPSQTICFTSTLGKLSAECVQTDVSGQVQVGLTSTEVGTATVTATAGGLNEVVNVVFRPSGLLLTASPEEVLANGEETSSLTVEVKDGDNDPVPDVTIRFTSTLGNLSSECTPTNEIGIAQIVLTSTEIGTATVTATRDLLSQTVLVSFTPPSLTLTASLTETWANGKGVAMLTASVSDYWGSAVPSQTVCFTSTLGHLSAECVQTDEIGQAQAALTSTKIGTSTVNVTIGSLSQAIQVEFVHFEAHVYLPLIIKSPANHSPNAPHNPTPADKATGQSLNVDLSWSGGDIDEDDRVTYDVYFWPTGSAPNDPLCDDVESASCDPGTLRENTLYHWYVVAHDNHGAETPGMEWSFTTTCPCNDNHEPDDNRDQSLNFNPLKSGEPVNGYICDEHLNEGQEEDWYWFNLTSLGKVSVDLDVPALADYDLFLWTGDEWIGSENPVPGADEHVEWANEGIGKSFVHVKSSGDYDNCTPYTLEFNFE